MKEKKTIMYVIIILIILFILGIGYLVYININGEKEEEIKEFIPGMEISEEQLRLTIVNLYFYNKETKSLQCEKREIDSKLLLENPYKTLISLLIEGPKNEILEPLSDNPIQIESVALVEGNVNITFNANIIENEEKEKILNVIEKTLKELNEVEKVNIIYNINE